MARTPEQAITWAQQYVGKSGWDNLCLSFVRQAFGVDYTPASAWPTSERQAGRAWDRAQHKHPTSDPDAIPRGVPVFWELNTEADHVALSLGGGWCLSNDFVVDGRIDRVRIADISARWGRLVGWTEDLVGNRVVPKPAAPAAPKGLRVDGVDISHHQAGSIDYAAAKTAGVKWLYHKATEGATYTDPNYDKRRAEAKAAGVPFGAYHFARAGKGDAALEAKHFLTVAAPKPGDLRPALDLETTEGLSITELRSWAAAFVAEVKRQTGVLPVVYTPFDLADSVAGCVIWRPRYNDSNTPPELAWDIWQFSNGVYGRPDTVAGFGHVDLNTMRDGLTVDDLLIPKRRRRRRRWVGPVVAVYYNVGDGNPDAKRHDLDRFATKGAHLILLAECSDRVALLKAWAAKNGWVYTDGDGSPGAAATPALIRADLYACAKVTTTEAVPATRVGRGGAGPDTMKRKVVQRVEIRRRWKLLLPRRTLRVAWGHYLPSATRPALPNHELRQRLHRQHTRAVLAALEAGTSLDLAVHDYNAEWTDALMDPYRKAGFTALPTGPTHGVETIDYWLTRAKRSRRADRVRKGIVRAFTVAGSSDHNAVVIETT